MRTFFIIWIGEVASVTGSGLTSFALGLWIYEKTGSVSQFTITLLAYLLPHTLVTPFAGVLADRWNRKVVMIMDDAGAGLASLAIYLLAAGDALQVWHIYVAVAFSSAAGSLQWPAYAAAIPLIVPKEHLGRASGMSQAGSAISELLSPLVAGSLYTMPGVGLTGILFIDFATFAFSTITLIIARIPSHKVASSDDADGVPAPASVWAELRAGWQYITQYPGLVRLVALFTALNFLGDFIYPLAQPLLFELTTPARAGSAMSIMAVGMFVGIAIMTFWGGPQRRIYGILIPAAGSSVAILLAGLRPSLPLITAAGFAYFALLPILEGSDQALLQTKIAHAVQGRVFALLSMIGTALSPLAVLLTGPLTDYVFEPAMRADGALAGSVGQIIGTGPGRGMGLFIVIIGILGLIVTVIAFLNPRIRLIEDEMPDASPPPESTTATTPGESLHAH